MSKSRNDRFVTGSAAGIAVDDTEGHGPDLLSNWLNDDRASETVDDGILNKSELISAVARETGVSQAAAARVISAALGTIKQALAAGEVVTLRDFGKFEVETYEKVATVNPKVAIVTKGKKRARSTVFTPGKALRKAVQGKPDEGSASS
ncbi:MAG: hypothetical protein B7Y88_02515 [Sphingomonadales bacterium 32-64-17]|nr:MAG: hypothetical protein B7Y88_02515 [Sphingomonadales bacterium 32-64-17]